MGLFSSGKLTLNLETKKLETNTPFKGTVSVSVPSATEGCTLKVELIGRARRKRSVFEKKKTNPWKTFFKEEIILLADTTVEGDDNTHEFEFIVDDKSFVIEANMPDSTLGKMAETFIEHAMKRQEYNWDIYARLVVPGMFNDLKDNADLDFTPPEDRVRDIPEGDES